MKVWKKLTSVGLAIAMCLVVFSACSSASEQEQQISSGDDVQQQQEQAASTPTTEEDELVVQSDIVPEEEEQPEEGQAQDWNEVQVAQTDIDMLNIDGNFMLARSIDGIDAMNDKVVALTFDDGPHPERTDQLLAVLEQNGVPATFFVLGENVERYPDVLKRVYEAGHEIGTHSYDHTDLMTLSYDQIISEQYGKTNDLIEQAVGTRALIDRPPYGSMSEEMAQQIGRAQVMWNVDPEEWKEEYKNSESLYDNVINGTNSGFPARDGSVVLSHDIHQVTVDSYDRIIKELLNQGYKFVTVTQMMQIAEARGKEVDYKFNGAPTVEQAKETLQPGGSQPAESGAGGEGAADGGAQE